MNLNFRRRKSSKIFWPRWYIRYSNGDVFPARHSGPQRGPRPGPDRDGGRPPPQQQRETKLEPIFMRDTDIMFINNYVFEHCESRGATVDYAPDGALPTVLASVKHVAVHASCLSAGAGAGPGDSPWGRQLRFILGNFPGVETITVVATAVLDAARPGACPLPYEMLSIEAVALSDRARLGIVDDRGELETYSRTASGRPGNFAIQAWEDLERHWPAWKLRRQATKAGKEKETVRPAPELCLTGVAFFAEEWLDMEKNGEHGRSCRLVEEKLNPAVRSAAKLDKTALAAPEGHIRRTSSGTMYSTHSLKRTGLLPERKPRGSQSLWRMMSPEKVSTASALGRGNLMRARTSSSTSRVDRGRTSGEGLESPRTPTKTPATLLMFQHSEQGPERPPPGEICSSSTKTDHSTRYPKTETWEKVNFYVR